VGTTLAGIPATLAALATTADVAAAVAAQADIAEAIVDIEETQADVALIHTHVGTIDGHITADYGSTEKTALDGAAQTAGTIATVTNLTNLPAAAATAAELAKVPKSDSNVSWNAAALAAINAEVDTALNTAIPGSPTGDSINERVKALDILTEASGTGDLAAIKTKTGYLPSVTAGGAGGVFIAGSNAATSVATALTANITGNVSGSVGSVTTVSDKTGYALSAAGVDAIYDEATAGHTTTGSFGKLFHRISQWLWNVSVEDPVTHTVSVKDESDDTTELGTSTWDEATGTRGRWSATL
jgi:hypothetical protein